MKIKNIKNIYIKIINKIKLWTNYQIALKNKKLFVSSKISAETLNSRERNITFKQAFITDPENLLHTPATLLNDTQEYKKPFFYNYDSYIIEHLREVIKIYKGSPLAETQKYENVIYLPQYRCFYFLDGTRIDSSCVPEYPIAPKTISVPKNLPTLKQKVIYGGHLHRHYGHFITECIGRLWYLAKETNCFVIYSETPRATAQQDFVDRFFRFLNLDKSRFISISQPVLCQEVVIPYSSFLLNTTAFSVHKVLLESVTKAVLQDPPVLLDQPLYISRTKLGINNALRAIDNEEIIEDKLRERNFMIYHPEKDPLEKQIATIKLFSV